MSGAPRLSSKALARRRGSVLVLVLGVSSIVGVIGLSALLAVRLQHRDVQSRADAVQAQTLADSALQLVHTRLGEDPGWRSNHTHDTWTADEDLGDGSTLRYKLVDEDDADLADNENDPARLVVRIAHGVAVRLASVELGGAASLGSELVSNGDLEEGTNDYFTLPNSGDVVAYTDYPYVGTTYLQLQNRTSNTSGLHQDLDGKIESGKQYLISAWVRGGDSNEYLTAGLYYPSSTDTSRTQGVTTLVDRYQWTEIRGVLQPEYNSYTAMRFFLSSSTSNQDLHLGQLSIREILSTALPVIRGSYRRELDD